MKSNLQNKLQLVKKASLAMAGLSTARKNQILSDIGGNIAGNKNGIVRANKKDIADALRSGKGDALIDRLTITDGVFSQMVDQIKQIRRLQDPIGKIMERKVLTNGVKLQKVSVPIGVIGAIYESRPNVTVDIVALAIKAGNAVVLKGGPEAIRSNRELIRHIHTAMRNNGISTKTALFLDDVEKEIVDEMVKYSEFIDVIIPRGGYQLMKKVAETSTIPILYHAAGGARIYVDETADLDLAVTVCLNAKTNRPAACNSLDTIVAHGKIARRFLKKFYEAVKPYGVEVRGDNDTRKILRVKKRRKMTIVGNFWI